VQHFSGSKGNESQAQDAPKSKVVLMATKRKPTEPPAELPTRRDDLLVMRSHLMAALLSADPSVAAQIVGQLRAVVKELDELPVAKPESALAKARAVRAAGRSNLKAV